MVDRMSAEQIFRSVDAQDTEAFLSALHPEASFRFGNAEAVVGHEALRPVLNGFFGALKGLEHRLEQTWEVEDARFCHGQVTYHRHDGSDLSVPFATLFRYRDGLIADYRIFVDASALFSGD